MSMEQDLAKSGLAPLDIKARPMSSVELAAVGAPQNVGGHVEGYVIPYYSLTGKPIPYYRVKFLGNIQPKYKPVKGGENHIYFPPRIYDMLMSDECDYLIITEGEKKAACATKRGFPAVALSGVDSWRVRTLVIPESAELKPYKQQGVIKARLPAGDSHNFVATETGTCAVGFVELVDFCVAHNICVILCFDTDHGAVSTDVQRAAATLAYELRYRGVQTKNIRQLVLPGKKDEKMGLDDYIMQKGSAALQVQIRHVRSKRNAFPSHPNARNFIASKLQQGRMTRKECQDTAMTVLSELETRGRRMRNTDTDELFYFDEHTHTLMPIFMGNTRVAHHDTKFGGFLYREFNIATADKKLLEWVATMFSGELGIEETRTHKVLARPESMPNTLAYQLSDTHYILIKANPEDPFEICVNGAHGILFEQGQVEPVNVKRVTAMMHRQLDEPVHMHWHDVIDGFNFSVDTDIPTNRMAANVEQSKLLCTLLFYLSPWMMRWKGMQLPVELMIGEAGSGKSSLYGMRQKIITGQIRLSNMTKDIKDWYAGITSRGGMYVLDNVKFTGSDKDYQQRLSDELCRLVTEPEPRVELRKLYTTSDVASMPVYSAFAVTSVTQPFFAVDLLQRSAIFEMQSLSSSGKHDANWLERQMDRCGGREGWLVHQLIVLHKFLALAVWKKAWDPDYHAGHRLAHYEQALILMADVFGQEHSWIPKALKLRTEHSVTDTDWTMTALCDFAAHMKKKKPGTYYTEDYQIHQIVDWALQHETHGKNPIMTNPWKLGRYMKSNLAMLGSAAGITFAGSKANKAIYMIKKKGHR